MIGLADVVLYFGSNDKSIHRYILISRTRRKDWTRNHHVPDLPAYSNHHVPDLPAYSNHHVPDLPAAQQAESSGLQAKKVS